ncbi:MAG: hypothetical protein JNN13_18150 [Planctomycetes bacterium]|nr:hypothetical protein [Planctomycetota bacterium]
MNRPPKSPASLLLPLFALAACGAAPVQNPPYAPRPVAELGRWQVFAGERLVGRVRKLVIEDPSGPLPFFRIEDAQGRWVGHATANGRFSRRVPFAEQEQDLGMWPMAEGVAELLEAAAPVRLEAVAVDADLRRAR